MTCAHIVNVALKKVDGVETVEVSLTKALASVRLKTGNKTSVAQIIKLIR
jgi:copper chaperone CopZ